MTSMQCDKREGRMHRDRVKMWCSSDCDESRRGDRTWAADGFLASGSRRSRACRSGFALQQGFSVRVRAGAGFVG